MPWIHLNYPSGDRRASDPGPTSFASPQVTSITFLDQTHSNRGWTLAGVELLETPGVGFRNAFYILGLSPTQLRTFLDFATLSILLEHHKTSGVLSDLPNHVLMDATVCTLHRLLCLPIEAPSTELETLSLHSTLKACRLAVLLYSFRHLFPLPRSAFPFLKMMRDLETALTQASSLDPRQAVQKALFWCAMVGAKATIGSPENRSFFVLLRQISSPWGIRNEEAALPILHMFAWPDSAHDPGFWSPPKS